MTNTTEENVTLNETEFEINETIEENSENESVGNESAQIFNKAVGEICVENNECNTGKCKNEKCAKVGFFGKLIAWLKEVLN